MKIKIIFLFIFHILHILIQSQNESNLTNNINFIKNNNISSELKKKEDIQNLNNIINIYNPFNIVSYISSTTNKNGNLFIMLATEEKSTLRLIYGIKLDGSSFFKDNNGIPYKIFNSSSYNHNKYPLISILKIRNNEYLASICDLMFELYDYNKNKVYSQGIFQTITFNSNIMKNTFISLDFYDNSDYILNAYIDKKERNFLLQKLYYMNPDISYKSIQCIEQTIVEEGDRYSQVSCFEIFNLIICLFVDEYKIYSLAIFNISNLNIIYNRKIEEIGIREHNLFGKCIYVKNNILAIIYFIKNNSTPTLQFKKINFILKEFEDYLEKLTINSKNEYILGYNYIFNDIIKIDENNLYYINSNNETDILMIIMIKLFDNSTNVLINYYKINLKDKYHLRIYKDITIFKFYKLLGIGMTHYNFSNILNGDNTTYASYFIVGESFINNLTIPDNINIFDEDKNFSIKLNKLIDIKNNIFGYIVKEIKLLTPLNETNLGFYLYSNYLNKTIDSNELLFIDDSLNFKSISNIGAKKDNYTFEFEGLITESEYNDFIKYPDSYEYYSNDNYSLEDIYQPQIFFQKKSYVFFSVNKCYKTCKECTYLGDKINHHCDICLDEYPFYYVMPNSTFNHGNNCINRCPENYTSNKYNICIPIEEIKDIETTYINNYKEIQTTNNSNYYNQNYSYNNNDKIFELIGFNNYIKIKSYIKEMSDNKIIIKNFTNSTIFAYEIGENREKFCIDNNLIYINLVYTKKNLIEILNLENDTNIYILMVESPSHYVNPVTNDFNFILVFENGTELNLSNININISVNISAPITNLELAHYDYAVEFEKQGYDIYDMNDSLYNNFCLTAYYKGNDITIDDRKKEVYPNNITIVNSFCIYKKVDLINQRFTCEYNINNDLKSENQEENFNTKYFDLQEKDDFLSYFLDNINYKIITCYEVFIHLENYHLNFGFYFSTTVSFLVLFLIVFFILHGLPKFKYLMFSEIPTYKKLNKIIKQQKVNKNIYNKRFKTFEKNPIKKSISNKSEVSSEKYSINTLLQSKSLIKSSLNDINIKKSMDNIIINNNKIYRKKIKNNSVMPKWKTNKNLIIKNKIKKYFGEDNIKAEISTKIGNYDDLPLTKAIRCDKRNIFLMLKSKIVDKLELFEILVSKKIKELPLSKYFLFLLIDLTLNALLYSDKVVSHKSHNNGKLNCFVTITLTLTSNLISLLIEHYLSLLTKSEKIIDKIKEIKQEYVFLKVYKNFVKIVTIQAITFLFISIISIMFSYYYLVIFCKIYSKSQTSLFTNYIISFAEDLLIKIIIILFIICTRKFGISYKSIYIYNTSKFVDRYS